MKIYKLIKVNNDNAHFLCFLSDIEDVEHMCKMHKDIFYRTVTVYEDYVDAKQEYEALKGCWGDDDE